MADDIEARAEEKGESTKRAEELHGKQVVSEVGKEIEEMWKRCGANIDAAFSQMAKAKVDYCDLLKLLGNKHYLN